uniref:Ig-like domain-containing protein n=1 Tax=Nothobranchius furzeri TaxID=105023 RepID=A0A8C6Q631_NOTFU
MALKCTPPIIDLPQKENLLDTDLSETQSTEAFREPLGSVSLGLSDQQGNSIDLTCNITHSTDSQDITPPPDLSWTSSSPLHLALSLSLECPIKAENYEKLWRILAYYSETAARFEREIMLSKVGELVTLSCKMSGSPQPSVNWILPDGNVVRQGLAVSVTVDTNGTLQIPVTLPSDRGLYRCVASNSAGAASSTVRVHVSSLPPVVQQPREEHLLFSPGRPAYAHCSARGAPPPSLRWRIPDGTQVRPSQFLHGNLFVLPNGTLHILKVGPQDAGSYECTASNTVGTSKRTVKVYQNGTLLIQAVTEKDGGEYLCITRNKVADDFRLLRVDVATRPAKIEPKQPPNHTVSLGKPLKVNISREI